MRSCQTRLHGFVTQRKLIKYLKTTTYLGIKRSLNENGILGIETPVHSVLIIVVNLFDTTKSHPAAPIGTAGRRGWIAFPFPRLKQTPIGFICFVYVVY